MSGNHLPAELREAHPSLTLPADRVAAAHLELEVDRRDVAPEGQDLEPQPRLLDARTRRARLAMRMDLGEAVAVIGEGVAHRMRAVPERRIEHHDVVVDQRLLIA